MNKELFSKVQSQIEKLDLTDDERDVVLAFDLDGSSAAIRKAGKEKFARQLAEAQAKADEDKATLIEQIEALEAVKEEGGKKSSEAEKTLKELEKMQKRLAEAEAKATEAEAMKTDLQRTQQLNEIRRAHGLKFSDSVDESIISSAWKGAFNDIDLEDADDVAEVVKSFATKNAGLIIADSKGGSGEKKGEHIPSKEKSLEQMDAGELQAYLRSKRK